MSPQLTHSERRLAAALPCTAASIAARYSQLWRSPDRRGETLFQAAVIAITACLLVGAASMLPSSPTSWSVPKNAVWLIGLSALIVGITAGHHSRRLGLSQLSDHWLAWCLGGEQRRREYIISGVWRSLHGMVGLIGVSLILSHWFVLSLTSVSIAAGWYAIGFFVSFALSGMPRAASLVTSVGRWAPRHVIPSALLLQASRPRLLLVCVVLALLIVGTLAASSILLKTINVLGVAMAVAVIGFAFALNLLEPSAVALHRLLAWTGAPPRHSVARLCGPPMTLALLLVGPVAVSALILLDPTWLVISLLGLVVAGYVTVIWIVGDIARLHGKSSRVLTFAHTVLPIAALASNPAAAPLLPLHLGWLLWYGDRLWRTAV